MAVVFPSRAPFPSEVSMSLFPRRSPLAPSRRNETGAAAVEFALVSVVLFPLLFGTVQYGLLLVQLQAATAAARDGARTAATGITDCAELTHIAENLIENNSLAAGTTALTARWETLDGQRQSVTVDVSFTPSHFLPFIPLPESVSRSATALVEETSPVERCA
jgi:Flp pilus assembly protein TadG